MKQLAFRYTCYWKVEGSHETFIKVKWLKQLPTINLQEKIFALSQTQKNNLPNHTKYRHTLFYCASQAFFLKQLKVCSNYVEQFDWCILLQSSINITFIYTGKTCALLCQWSEVKSAIPPVYACTLNNVQCYPKCQQPNQLSGFLTPQDTSCQWMHKIEIMHRFSVLSYGGLILRCYIT